MNQTFSASFSNYVFLLIIPLLLFFTPPPKKTKVWLIGDSTMSQKEVKAFPETGWGMPFSYFFDSNIVIDNRAKNGRSTRTFLSENLWQPVVDNLNKGDFVFIQFGHNDEVKTKTDRYTSPEDFKTNLIKMVTESRAKNAIPVLITPVARRQFDSLGMIKESHPVYADAVKEIAKQLNVPLIDLNKKSKELYQQFGAENSKWLFNYTAAGEHPNYPEGHKDDTHFNELGARKIAELVLAEIRQLDLGLAAHVRSPLPVKK